MCRDGPHKWIGALALLAVACSGRQSALDPAGKDAEAIAELFYWMAGGAGIIWLLVMGTSLYAIVYRGRRHQRRKAWIFIVVGGAVLPTILLTALLAVGLPMVPQLLDTGNESGPRIRIVAARWWWRVYYEMPDGSRFELANELRLPVGTRVPLWLESRDVIHAFWVPSLAGKVDMIPGRVNRAALEPTRTGIFRGVCAEYCGSSHARMSFDVVVLEPDAFADWARQQAQPAAPPRGELEERGARSFASLGCGACHTVRGTEADGAIGPDLTHVGSRHSVAAMDLSNDPAGLAQWLRATKHLKPGAEMPAFDMLGDEELHALAVYLDGLR